MLVALALCACSSANAPQIEGPDASASDVGPSVPAEGGLADAGSARDAGPATHRQTGDIACANFVDDDHTGSVDCADVAGCGMTHVCCVGSTSPLCCMPPSTLVPVLVLDGCTGSAPTDCVSGMLAFGTPLPTLAATRNDGGACMSGESIAPQGSDRSDGGLVATSAIDTSVTSVVIEATLGVSTSAAGTLDAIAVGLTDQTDLASTPLPRVRPLVAVIVSATDQTIRALAGDIAFPARPLASIFGTATTCSELGVRIVTSPAGTFDVFVRVPPSAAWQRLETARPFQSSVSAHLVTFGRSTNPGTSGVRAWVRRISIGSSVCDVFQPMREGAGVFSPLPLAGHSIRSVSRVGPLAVYEMDDAVYVAGIDGTGRLQPLGRSGPDGDRILAPGESSFMARALADPELVAIGDNRRVFFTGIDTAGVRSIGYLDFDIGLASRVRGSTPRQLVAPAQVGAIGVDGPAYFETSAPGSSVLRRWIVFRAVVTDTRSELRAAELVGSSAVLGIASETRDTVAAPMQFYTTMHPLSATDTLYANDESGVSAFDHDEIASPELVVYHGVIRVFFAARLGARWTIGMLRSPDFAHFELAYVDPVLRGSGAGFDAVSVSDPDVWLDTSGSLTLYYTGSDGTMTQPGTVTQQVPTP